MENVSEFFKVKLLVEDQIDQDTNGPHVGEFWLILAGQDFRRLVEFDFFFAFGGWDFGDFHVLRSVDVEVKHVELLWA